MIAFFLAEVLTISARKLETLGTFLAAVVKSFRLWAQSNQETLRPDASVKFSDWPSQYHDVCMGEIKWCIPSVSRQRSNPGRSMLTPYNMKSAEVAYWVKTETGEKSWYWKQKSIKLSQSQEFWLREITHARNLEFVKLIDEVDQYVGGRLATCCSLLFVRPSVQTWGVEKKTLKNWENKTLSWNW